MAVEIRYSGQVVVVASKRGTVTARAPSYEIDVSSGILSGGGMPYTGAYEAIPSWEQQVFPTAGRTMRNDFEVEGILKLEVDNEAGGLTLTI